MICEKIGTCSDRRDKPRDVIIDEKGGKSRFIVVNSNRVPYAVINFDHCVFENNQSSCDFGIDTRDCIYYVELKGSDTKKGVDQLLTTITQTQMCYEDKSLKGRLICSKVSAPKIFKKSREYKNMMRITKGDFKIASNQLEEAI